MRRFSLATRCLVGAAALAIGFAWAARAPAQPAAPSKPPPSTAEEYQPIEVVALGHPARLSRSDLKRAYAAYLKWRPVHAPAAKLYLVASFRASQQDVSGMKLRVVDERADSMVDMVIEPDGRALFPDLDYTSGGYSILADRKAGTLKLEIQAFSPGTGSTRRRFGDLRLQCRVWWAIAEPEVPRPMRAMFELAGAPCASKKAPLFIHSDRPIASAQVVAGSRRWPISVRNQTRYSLPLYDKSIPADATLEIAYVR